MLTGIKQAVRFPLGRDSCGRWQLLLHPGGLQGVERAPAGRYLCALLHLILASGTTRNFFTSFLVSIVPNPTLLHSHPLADSNGMLTFAVRVLPGPPSSYCTNEQLLDNAGGEDRHNGEEEEIKGETAGPMRQDESRMKYARGGERASERAVVSYSRQAQEIIHTKKRGCTLRAEYITSDIGECY